MVEPIYTYSNPHAPRVLKRMKARIQHQAAEATFVINSGGITDYYRFISGGAVQGTKILRYLSESEDSEVDKIGTRKLNST